MLPELVSVSPSLAFLSTHLTPFSSGLLLQHCSVEEFWQRWLYHLPLHSRYCKKKGFTSLLPKSKLQNQVMWALHGLFPKFLCGSVFTTEM